MANIIVEEKIENIALKSARNLNGNKVLEDEIRLNIISIINEEEIKTNNEEINDLALTLAKNLGTENNSETKIEAKKIWIELDKWKNEKIKEVEDFKKEEFKNRFVEETKKINPELKEEQLKSVKKYAEEISEIYSKNNEIDGCKNEILEANNQFSPGQLQNSFTDLKGIIQFLKKSPGEIKEKIETVKTIRENLKDVKLPNFRELRSFENIVANFGKNGHNNLFSKTQKYLGWADKVDKLTGGWLNRTVAEAGQKLAAKIGTQATREFATNALGTIAKEGFQKGFSTVLNGIMSGGVKAAGTAVTGAAATGGVAAAGAATGPPGWLIAAALLVAKKIKEIGSKIAEKLGISLKGFLEENFGKVGGKILGGILFLVGLPALLMGLLSTVFLAPFFMIIITAGFIYQITIGSLVSSLLPPKGTSDYVEVADTSINVDYSGSANTIYSYEKNGTIFYVFEGINGGNIKQSNRYDLGVLDPSWLEIVPGEYRKNCTYNGLSACQLDKRIIPAYIAMIKAARESGELKGCQLNEDLKLNWGYRTKAEQDMLWENSRNSAQAAPPDSISEHRTGRGMDIRINCGIGGEESFDSGYPIYKASSTFQWLLKNASKYGFYNYELEPWHWSYNPSMPASGKNVL